MYEYRCEHSYYDLYIYVFFFSESLKLSSLIQFNTIYLFFSESKFFETIRISDNPFCATIHIFFEQISDEECFIFLVESGTRAWKYENWKFHKIGF